MITESYEFCNPVILLKINYFGGVFTVITFENAELPAPLNALTRYRYQVFLVRPVCGNVVTFAPTVAICAKLVQLFPAQRSMLKPVSLFELSVQAKSTCDAVTAVTRNSVGASAPAAVERDVNPAPPRHEGEGPFNRLVIRGATVLAAVS